MREIKFRGIDLQRKEWVYGYFYTFGDHSFNIIEPGMPGIPEQHIAVEPSSIGQFTGLTDKAGKEIYEGDVVKITAPVMPEWSEKILKVEWWDREAKFSLGMRDAREEIEIIGDIYSNPELISSDKK